MAKQAWNNPIDKYTDWGGDSSTNYTPVSGELVQKFIKDTLDTKVGELYYDNTRNRYLAFADEDSRTQYLENPEINGHLLLGAFDAPFNYEAKITLNSQLNNIIKLGLKNNIIDFIVDIKNKEGLSTGENILCTYTIKHGANTLQVSSLYTSGLSIKFNIDRYLHEGVNNIIISIKGIDTLAATTTAITYNVINLELTSNLNISKLYDISSEPQVMSIPFQVSGYGTKIIEWFIDGVLQEFIKDTDEVVDIKVERTKYIQLSNLSNGTHNLLIRAYVMVNNEIFYSDTIYKEFMVYTGVNKDTLFAIEMIIPSLYGIVSKRKLYSIVQYIPYKLSFATHTFNNIGHCNVLVKLNNIEQGNIKSVNNITNEITILSSNNGPGVLLLISDEYSHNTDVDISGTNMNINEITDQLVLSFDASGKSNSSSDKDYWSYKEYTGEFNGFNWNDTSGWVDNTLYINNGSSFSINYAPLSIDSSILGKTIEIELCTTNVNNDDTIICDLRNENGSGILITATSIKMISEGGKVIETSYKLNEFVRFSLVINKNSNSTNSCMSFIYDNGIVSRGVAWLPTDKYISTKNILFTGSEGAEIKLKYLRIYDSALTSDLILNNYILYRDDVVEMNDIYERNNIYQEGTTLFDYNKMVGRLPVMIITGDIPALESTTDKNKQIVVDIDYYNILDPELSFSIKNAALRPLGTSSMGYPKKNFRPYTRKIENTEVYDSYGNKIENKLYAFKKGSQPVDCWCLKADFAESSGTHNTGIAKLWNNILFNATINDEYVFRTTALKKAIENKYPYDVRTTIDGFPILLFYRMEKTSPLTFIGKYNFNNDKSTEGVFGFKDIPDFDNSKMLCWEILNNGNLLALFNSTDDFDNKWSEAFESRYPDTKTPYIGDLKNFCTWMTNVTASDFINLKWEHLDVYKVAAYYVYLMRFGAVDQTVKNSMLTSEDGIKFYFIHYDNDTINGLVNNGYLITPWYVTRETLGKDGEPYYAGKDSRLWNLLELDSEFMNIVKVVDESLYTAGLTYENAISMFDDELSNKWVERVYNQDALYKYISPYVDNGIDNLFMLLGSRKTHRKYWLAKRFSLFDSKYITGDYKSQSIEFKCINNTTSGLSFSIKAGTEMDYGYGINNIVREGNVTISKDESYTFTTQEVINLGDPVRIYGAPNIKELDLSQLSDRLAIISLDKVYNINVGTKLKKLILGNENKNNIALETISGLSKAQELEYIDIQNLKGLTSLNLSNLKNIKYVNAKGSKISSIEFGTGAPIETLMLPDTMKVLYFDQLPKLSKIESDDFSKITSITCLNCLQLSTNNNYNFLLNWINSKLNIDDLYLEMDNILWDNISYDDLIKIGSIKNKKLSGKIILNNTTITNNEIEKLLQYFGDNCLTANNSLYIDVPNGAFILNTTTNITEGDNLLLYSKIVPTDSVGTISWNIIKGGVLDLIIDQNGLLITYEKDYDRTITVQLLFTDINGLSYSDSKEIFIQKSIRPKSCIIEGSEILRVNESQIYNLIVSPENVNRDYTVNWSLSNNDNNYVLIEYYDNTKCQIKTTSSLSSGIVTLKSTIVCDNGETIESLLDVRLSVQLLVSLLSNQPNDLVISESALFGVKYDGVTIVGSHNEIINIPFYKDVVIEFYDVDGYKSPENITFTTTTDNMEKSAMYYTELLELCIIGEGVEIPNTLNVKVNNKTYTWNNSNLKIKIPYNATYDIILPDINEEILTPSIQRYVANTEYRLVTCKYEPLPNMIKCTLDTTDCIGTSINLIGNDFNISQISKMSIDGLYLQTPVKTYIFDSGGNHTVDIIFDKNNFTSCSRLFFYCDKGYTYADFSNFDTSTVTDMDNMFYSSSFSELDCSNFNTSAVTNMSYMFSDMRNLTQINVSNFDTSNVTNMSYMFLARSGDKISEIDISNFDFSKAINLTNLFYGRKNLTSIILPTNFNLLNINASYMFSGTGLTQFDLSNIQVNDKTYFNGLFASCLNLTNVNMNAIGCNNITNLSYVFSYCPSLTTIDLSNYTSLNNLNSAFLGCLNLKEIKLNVLTAPAINNSTFGTSSTSYTGYNTHTTGENKLYVPSGATGYNSGYWSDPLCNSSKCGFTISYTL